MFDLVQEPSNGVAMSRTLVHVLNHGEPIPENLDELSERGKNQVFELARSRIVTGVRKLYSSPMKEAKATSRILREEFDTPVDVKDCLTEVALAKKRPTYKEMSEILPEMWEDSSFAPKKGESLIAAQKRIGECLTSIAKRNSGDSVAIILHPIVCLLFDNLVCGGEPTPENWLSFGYASCATYEYSKDGWVLVMPFDNSFLSDPSSVSDTLLGE